MSDFDDGGPAFPTDGEYGGYSADMTLSEALRAERDAWEQTAAQFSRNEDYYRGLIDSVAPMLGAAMYTQDDGGVVPEPLRACLPKAVAKLKARAEEAEAALADVAIPTTRYMTLRDWFAGQASEADVDAWMHIMRMNNIPVTREEAKYYYADAMLAAAGMSKPSTQGAEPAGLIDPVTNLPVRC